MAGAMDDVTRSVQIFSSVLPASDYNSYFAVRGGSPEQNLVIMDGVIIPNPYRFRLFLGGGLSVFNPAITEDVRLHIGGFSAEFGNFLSSVLEVDTREGNRSETSGKVSLNLVDASFVLEGPISQGNSSWLISGRRTYYDLMANRFSEDDATFPNSGDFNIKSVFQIDEKNKVTAQTMINTESANLTSKTLRNFTIGEDSEINLLILDWLRIASPKLTHRTTFSYYWEDFDFSLTRINTDPITGLRGSGESDHLTSEMINVTFREDIIYELSPKIWMTRGMYFSTTDLDFNFDIENNTLSFGRRVMPPRMDYQKKDAYFAFYMDDIYKLYPSLHIKAGLRYEYSDLFEQSMVHPRLSIWHAFSKAWHVDGSWGTTSQNPNPFSTFIRNQGLDLSNNLELLKPEKAMLTTLGLSCKLAEEVETKIEFYYRELNDLLFPVDQQTKIAANIGEGYSKGIEFYLKKDINDASKFGGLLSYSYGIARYRDPKFHVWLPMSFDRRHSFSLMFNTRLLSNLSLNLMWRLSSGLPYTSSYGLLAATSYSDSHFYRDETGVDFFPWYQRMDLRLNYEHRHENQIFTMYLDLTNIYDHRNVYDEVWDIRGENENNDNLHILEQNILYMLPLLPTFGISYQF